MMLRVAAKEKGGAMIMDDAIMFASQFWPTIGIAPNDVQLTDGSGLSRNDLVTPRATIQLLTYAARQPWGTDFMNSLPIAGEDGTLENRMKSTAAQGRVRAKTGSVNHANALSGYATTARGERLVFSIFGSSTGMSASDASATLDAVCVAMVEELGAAATTPQPPPVQ
jgi:D-alanyl-D-alanine carboxypeptidase/D-alanyl-D-alanine-endopeptidase (penicillin-binding protein 4)